MIARHLVSSLLIFTALSFRAAAKPQITTKTVPDAVVGSAYNQTISVNGSQDPNTWSMSAGSLPPGLSLGPSSGALTGTPTTAGTFSFTVRVVDRRGDDDTQALSIFVTSVPPLVITTESLPNGTVGASYSRTLAATGGSGGYSWSRTGGSLSAGLSLSTAGAITGTPTAFGTWKFTVRVTDSGGRTANKDLSLTIDPPFLSITTASLPSGRVGDPYATQTLQATGGSGGNTWSVSAGSLPPGLNLSGAGAITGTPAAAGTLNFTVRVADNGGRTATKTLTITVEFPVLTISTNTVAAGIVGEPYSFTLAATGGRTPYTWRIADGALPNSLVLNATSGVISGTPAAAGTFNFTVEVIDAAGLKTTRVHTLVVNLPLVTTLRLSGVPATLGPMQQPPVGLVISDPYPVAITGRLNLAFMPADRHARRSRRAILFGRKVGDLYHRRH